jgi:hypothetical protein
MKDMLQKRPFVVAADGYVKLDRVSLTQGTFDEEWLQKLIEHSPQLLPVAEIDAIYAPLVCIGREVVTDVGRIDNLFISPKGYLTIVETKLWRNPQARREVVGQIIDYAKELKRFSYEDLDGRVRAYNRDYNGKNLGLFASMVEQNLLTEHDEKLFVDLVEKNLSNARFLLLVVGDGIRESVWRMAEFLNSAPHMLYNIALVELEVYKLSGEDKLVVPNLLMKTQTVERGVFRFEQGAVETVLGPEIAAEATGRRSEFTREDFVDLLVSENPRIREEAITKFLDDLTDLGFEIARSGKADLRIRYPMPGGQSYLNVIYLTAEKGGRAYKYIGSLERDLVRTGYSEEIAVAFYREIEAYHVEQPARDKTTCHDLQKILDHEDEVIATFDRLRSNF